MRSFWIIFFSAVILFATSCMISYFAVGSGGDTPPPQREIEETSEADAETTGEFHAWVEHPEHIFDPNLMRVSIRLFPDANAFPGFGIGRCESVRRYGCASHGSCGCVRAVVECADSQPSTVAYPARKGARTGST